jgi:glycosyltransferase involved in cell wall biosynthesis
MDKIYDHQTVTESHLPSVAQDFPISLVQANADATPAVIGHYADELARAAYRIGLWVWELPAARLGTFEAIRNYDEIWVPTRFCQNAYQPLTKLPVNIVPYALRNLPILAPDNAAAMRDTLGIPRDNFVFLYMFDTYSLVERKNPTCLLEAFEAEFAGRSDVTLVLKVSYFDNLKSSRFKASFEFLTRLQLCMERCPNIKLITAILPQHDLYRLINAADCYVSPHRSEGFGLTIAESMFYRKIVIATDFSGTTDLVQDDTGLKLNYTLRELEEDVPPYGRGNIWADPSVMHLRELMQTALSDTALGARLGEAGHTHVVRHFSPQHIGRIAVARLSTIASSL